MSDFTPFASAKQYAENILKGRISSVDVVDILKARHDKYHPQLNAVIYTDWDCARADAARRDAELAKGSVRGPLHGVPITIKDPFDVVGMPSTWGTTELKDNVPTRNAASVDRLVAAGAVIFGKTNVPRLVADHQTFNPLHGITNNPWDLARTPSGSSGGAAVALAAGLTGFDIGSDIGGSIRQPSHSCGIYGHKPTMGICSIAGHDWPGDLAPLDMGVVGPMGRSAEDLDIGLSILQGPNDMDADAWRLTLPDARSDLGTLRVGIMFEAPAAPVDREIRAALENVAVHLERLGVHVTRDVAPLGDTHAAFGTYVQLLRSATSAHLTDEEVAASRDDWDALPAGTTGYFADTARGRTLSHRHWLRVNEARMRIKREWQSFFTEYDILVCPASSRAASLHDTQTLRHLRQIDVSGHSQPATNDLFWAGFNGMAFLPATVAPIGQTKDGLPIGMQIVGKWYADRTTIALAKWLERSFYAFVAPSRFA